MKERVKDRTLSALFFFFYPLNLLQLLLAKPSPVNIFKLAGTEMLACSLQDSLYHVQLEMVKVLRAAE